MKTHISPSDYATIMTGYESLMDSMERMDLWEFRAKMHKAHDAGTLDDQIFYGIDDYADRLEEAFREEDTADYCDADFSYASDDE